MIGKRKVFTRARVNMITHGLLAVLLLIVFAVVLPQFTFFHGVWPALRHQNLGLLGLALLTYAATYLSAAGVLLCLDPEHLAFWPTALVQSAAAFLDRLLPAGSGSIGVNYAYLRRHHADAAEAGSIVAMNNLLGFIGCLTIVLITLFIDPSLLHRFNWRFLHHVLYLVVTAVALLAILSFVLWHWGPRVVAFLRIFVRDFIAIGRRPHQLLMAFGLSMGITLLFALTFFLCIRAAGVPLTMGDALVIFAFSVIAGVVTPAPGGIGGAEAAIVAGLVSFGVHGGRALVIALIFRFITYWLAILVGAVSFVFALRQHLFTEHL